MEDTVLNETCIHSHIVMEQNVVKRKTVNDTDTGKVLPGEYCGTGRTAAGVSKWYAGGEVLKNRIMRFERGIS